MLVFVEIIQQALHKILGRLWNLSTSHSNVAREPVFCAQCEEPILLEHLSLCLHDQFGMF